MVEDIGLILIWIVIFLIGLWALLRYLPHLIRFFRNELKRAKDKVADTDSDTMVIRVQKKSKKESDNG